jgi:hypothetical protein
MDTRLIDASIVGYENYRANEEKWLSLRCGDFFNNNVLKSYNELCNTVQPRINLLAYLAIRKSIVFAFKKYRYIPGQSRSVSVEYILNLKNKNSKIFR